MSYDPHFQQRIFEMLQESQYWPEQQMRDFQKQQLEQLLKFAHENVPFYKERLANAITPDGTVNWNRWNEIPILTRGDLLDHRDAMLATRLPPGHGYVDDHLGSGTTGKPVTTRHNSLTPLVSNTGLYRAFKWHGVSYDKIICEYIGEDANVAQWPDGQDYGPWGPHWAHHRDSGKLLRINRAASPEQVAEFLSRKKVNYFSTRPNLLQAVAHAAEKLGLDIKLLAIMTVGSEADELTRDTCRRVFGAEIISLYASKEVYNIGHQCTAGDQYHINSEMMLLEVLDDTGRPCPVGQRGRAIVTHFYNTSQPFIRYDLGDQIIMAESCVCGRKLPVIEKIAGRTTHLFRLPRNRRIALSLPAKHMKILSARGWQIAQTAEMEIEVRYIPDGTGLQPNTESFTELLRGRTDLNLNVSYKIIDELPLMPSGKFIEFVCELPPES